LKEHLVLHAPFEFCKQSNTTEFFKNRNEKTILHLWEEKKNSLSCRVTTASDITGHRFKHLSDAKDPVLSAITVLRIKQPPR